MKLAIHEILEQASAKRTRVEKIEFLQSHGDNQTLLHILQWALHKDIVWGLPEGKPPFTPSQAVGTEGMLYKEARRLYLFLTPESGGNPDLSQPRREYLFIQLLESLTPKEAELLCSVKDKVLPYKQLTYNLVNRAFPGLLELPNENQSEDNEDDE